MTIDEILKSKQLEQFIGLKEDLHFESKRANNYDLEVPASRVELAKDVSAMANSDGGYLVLGLVTEPILEERTDWVTALDLISEADAAAGKLQGVIREYIHPTIVGLSVAWVESSSQAGLGVVAINVPLQDQGRKWFLMGKVMEAGNQLQQIVFGIAQRIDSSNEPFTLEQVHVATQSGRTPMATRLTRMEAKLDSILERAASSPTTTPDTKLSDRIKQII